MGQIQRPIFCQLNLATNISDKFRDQSTIVSNLKTISVTNKFNLKIDI